MVSSIKYLLLILCLVLLTSCGFHLRGNVNLSPPLKRLYIRTPDPYGPLAKQLRSYLATAGVDLANDPTEATTVLEILSESETQVLLSVSRNQQTRQYNLILTVSFQITDPQGKLLVPAQTVSETCSLTIQSNQILGSSSESQNLYQQLRRTILFDIMNKLSSNQTAAALEAKQ